MFGLAPVEGTDRTVACESDWTFRSDAHCALHRLRGSLRGFVAEGKSLQDLHFFERRREEANNATCLREIPSKQFRCVVFDGDLLEDDPRHLRGEFAKTFTCAFLISAFDFCIQSVQKSGFVVVRAQPSLKLLAIDDSNACRDNVPTTRAPIDRRP